MSNHAKQRPPAVPTLRPPRLEPETGRFRVGHGQANVEAKVGSTIVPPSGGVEVAEVSLDSLGAILELDGAETAEHPADSEGTHGSTSGVYATAQQQTGSSELDELGDIISSSRPYYEQREPPEERAQLEFEDLSLRLDNRYVASSLVPPPRKSVPVGKLLAVAGAAATAVGAALLLWSQPPAAVSTPVESSKHSVAPQASVPPVVQAPTSASIAPAAVQVPASVLPAPEAPTDVAPAPDVRVAAVPVEGIPVEAMPVEAMPVEAMPVEAIRAAPLAPARPTRSSAEPSAVPVENRAVPSELPAAVTPSQGDSAGAQVQVAAATATAEAAEVVNAAPVAEAPVAALAPVESGETVELPEVLTREAVTLGFEKIRDQITSCAAGKHGIVTLNVTIASRGRLSGVLVDGIFKGTPEGSCMARAARAASFPPFSQSTLKVSYPISI